ncbi:MAG: FtsX-like permease family protein [Planctomycetes bacterium]|nr:FtsX-like permease family protein [Planctomycetota bacterium]
MYKLFLALRYLRKRKISLLSVLGVAAGVMTLLVVTSIMGGFARDLRARIRGMTAHVTVLNAKGARYRMIEDWEKLAEKVKSLPEVEAVAPQIEWPIMMDKGPKGAMLVGILPEAEAAVSGFADHLLDAHAPDFSSPSGKALGPGMWPAIIGSNVLGYHENKDVVFVAAGPGANATIADIVMVVNAKDGFEILVEGDEFAGKLARGTPETKAQAAEWIRSRPDAAPKNVRALLNAAFELIAYDAKKENRLGYVVFVSAQAAPGDDVRYAWQEMDPDQRAILQVSALGMTLREQGREPIRNAWVFPFPPGADALKRAKRDLGSGWVDYGISITTITPSDIRERSGPVGIQPTKAKLAIVGVFNSGMAEYDSQIIYVPLEAAQILIKECRWEQGEPVLDAAGHVRDGRINKLRIRIRDYDRTDEFRQKLDKLLGGQYDITTWQEEKSILLQAVAVERTLNGVILFFIVLVAAFSIFAILTMMVTEKTRDIGILRALGAGVPGIMSIFLAEGLVIGIVGCALGAGSAAFILDNLNPLADEVYEKTGWYPFPKDIYLLDQIPHQIEPAVWALVIGATLFVCLLAALFPAWKAARLVPVEALRYE